MASTRPTFRDPRADLDCKSLGQDLRTFFCLPFFFSDFYGYRGGKARAPITQDEADWKMVQNQLRAQVMRTKGRLESICVSFDLDQMDGYKNHKRVCSHLASLSVY